MLRITDVCRPILGNNTKDGALRWLGLPLPLRRYDQSTGFGLDYGLALATQNNITLYTSRLTFREPTSTKESRDRRTSIPSTLDGRAILHINYTIVRGGRHILFSPDFILPRTCIGCSVCTCSHGISDTSYSYNVESTSWILSCDVHA
jgi:hypothetical protein